MARITVFVSMSLVKREFTVVWSSIMQSKHIFLAWDYGPTWVQPRIVVAITPIHCRRVLMPSLYLSLMYKWVRRTRIMGESANGRAMLDPTCYSTWYRCVITLIARTFLSMAGGMPSFRKHQVNKIASKKLWAWAIYPISKLCLFYLE